MNNYEFSWKIIAHFSTQNRNRCGRNRSFCNLYGIKRSLSSDDLLVFFAFRQPQKGGFARTVKDKGGRFVYGFISYARKILLHRITRHICPNEGTYGGYTAQAPGLSKSRRNFQKSIQCLFPQSPLCTVCKYPSLSKAESPFLSSSLLSQSTCTRWNTQLRSLSFHIQCFRRPTFSFQIRFRGSRSKRP